MEMAAHGRGQADPGLVLGYRCATKAWKTYTSVGKSGRRVIRCGRVLFGHSGHLYGGSVNGQVSNLLSDLLKTLLKLVAPRSFWGSSK